MNGTMQLILNLKEQEQDFEFYPTTSKMINSIINSEIRSYFSLLDVGAGNGNFLAKFSDLMAQKENHKRRRIEKYFVIEKSKILRDLLPDDAIVVGCDLFQNTLIDKNVDYIFCNPPYSLFEIWAEKIIEEGNFTEAIFLILPHRWKNNSKIMQLLKARNLKFEIIFEDDFLDAERSARAKIEIIKITHDDELKLKQVDAFDIFLNSLGIVKKQKKYLYEENIEKKEKIENEILEAENALEVLLRCYNNDFQKLLDNYKKLGELSDVIFEELNFGVNEVKEALKQRITGLKNLHWRMLFDRFEPITNNLISAIKDELLSSLIKRNNIDFNRDNIYMIADYILKHCSDHYDEQLKQVFLKLAEPKNIKYYKSNQKVFKQDGWQYLNEKDESFSNQEYRTKLEKVNLDYRIVLTDNYNQKIIKDILVIARNLGFDYKKECFLNYETSHYKYNTDNTITFGAEYIVYDRKDENELLSFRLFKNDNIHIKLNKEFLKALNIEVGRIFGWIHSKDEAVAEMDIDDVDFEKYYNCNFKIKNGLKLLGEID